MLGPHLQTRFAMPSVRISILLFLLLTVVVSCGEPPADTATPATPPPTRAPDPERVGSVSDAVVAGSSIIDVARADPGSTYAEFRACVVDTGEPIAASSC